MVVSCAMGKLVRTRVIYVCAAERRNETMATCRMLVSSCSGRNSSSGSGSGGSGSDGSCSGSSYSTGASVAADDAAQTRLHSSSSVAMTAAANRLCVLTQQLATVWLCHHPRHPKITSSCCQAPCFAQQ